MPNEQQNSHIQKQFEELRAKYKGLGISVRDDGLTSIKGPLRFIGSYEGIELEDEFEVEIILPAEYPELPPVVQETGGRIPVEYHRNPGGTLCLGAPLEVRIKFGRQRNLIGFVEELLVHYLFSFSYYERNDRVPFGELSHGGRGIWEYYRELFDIEDDVVILELLKILADQSYRGHHDCPCNSGQILRNCHGRQLLEIQKYQSHEDFLLDYCDVLHYLLKCNGDNIPVTVMAKSLEKKLRQLPEFKQAKVTQKRTT
jgi:hypothetical protein